MTRRRRTGRSPERGFSLIEVILALGLLASVLISVAGMFVLGSRQVKSGRTHSTALSVARDVLEEISSWGFQETYEAFGPNLGGSPAVPPISTLTDPFASRWQPVLEQHLDQAHAEIRIESVDDDASGPPDLDQARAIRVEVTVYWREGPRRRSLKLATVRM